MYNVAFLQKVKNMHFWPRKKSGRKKKHCPSVPSHVHKVFVAFFQNRLFLSQKLRTRCVVENRRTAALSGSFYFLFFFSLFFWRFFENQPLFPCEKKACFKKPILNFFKSAVLPGLFFAFFFKKTKKIKKTKKK